MSNGFAQDVVGGGDNLPTDVVAAIGKASTKLDDLVEKMAEAKDTDTERWTQLNEERKAEALVLDELQKAHGKAKIDAEQADAAADAAARRLYAEGARNPSKAHLIGSGNALAPSFGGYQKGSFVYNIYRATSPGDFMDSERQEALQILASISGRRQGLGPDSQGSIGGKAQLHPDDQTAPGVGNGGWALAESVIVEAMKATLGTAASTGSGLIPNPTIDSLVKPGRYRSAVTSLTTNIRGVSSFQATVPVRATAPSRAVVAPWGDTKENVNLTYGGYTATMYTLARIYDVAKQFLRFSQGAAEQDILQELAHAFELGEAYYILQGSGTDEPYGIQTAIATAFSAYTTSFTASATTLAGSIAHAIAEAAGGLAVRNRFPEAALLSPAAYWTMVAQGTDTAGFFFAPSGGPEQIRPGTLMSPFGLPVYSESQLAGTDDLLIGEFSALKVYFGEAYRVDTSDVAGNRWDTNLVGFRGEEEIGLDARPAVFTGAFQFVADVMP